MKKLHYLTIITVLLATNCLFLVTCTKLYKQKLDLIKDKETLKAENSGLYEIIEYKDSLTTNIN